MIQLDTPREQRLRERLDIVRDQRDTALERLSLRDRAPLELNVERRRRVKAEVEARLLRAELVKSNRAWRADFHVSYANAPRLCLAAKRKFGNCEVHMYSKYFNAATPPVDEDTP